MVDSSDFERLAESRQELFAILEEPELRGVPIVIIANKQDLPMAMSPDKLIDALKLRRLVGRPWHLQGACAPHSTGVYESIECLAAMIKNPSKH